MIRFVPIVLLVEDGMPLSSLQAISALPGVAKVNLNLDAPPEKRLNGRHIGSEPPAKAADLILQFLQTAQPHPVDRESMEAEFAKRGRNPRTVASSLQTLRKAGLIEAAGRRGYWKLVASPQPQEPALAALPAPAKKGGKRPDIAKDAVIAELVKANGAPVTRKTMAAAVEAAGRQAKGVYRALHELRNKEKFVKIVSPGVYEFTNAGKRKHLQTGE